MVIQTVGLEMLKCFIKMSNVVYVCRFEWMPTSMHTHTYTSNGHRDCLLLNENEAKEEKKNWMKRIDVYTKSKFINGDES